jgi:hypothetical protein
MNAVALGRDVAPLGRSLGATGFARGAPQEVSVLFGNAYSHLSKVPLQGFGKIPAALCDGFPAKPPSTPAGFRLCFYATGGFIAGGRWRLPAPS